MQILEDDGYVDDWILREALSTGATVCTNDTQLRSRVRSKGIRAVSMGVGGRFR